MKQKKDILAGENVRRRSYTVPQGYFDTLRTSLYMIPQRQDVITTEARPVGRGRVLRPIFAIAACVVVALCVCLPAVRRSATVPETLSYEQMLIADLVPYTGVDDYYYGSGPDYSGETSTREDLYEYLLSGGTSTTVQIYETDY